MSLLKVTIYKDSEPYQLTFKSPTVRMLNQLESNQLTSNSEVVAKLIELGDGKIVKEGSKAAPKELTYDEFLDFDLSSVNGVQQALQPFLLPAKQ